MKKKSGFTLIELMIVVAIIAILAAIALPAYQQYTRQSRYSDLQTAADGLKTNISVCFAKTGDLTKCNEASELGLTALPSTTNYTTTSITAAAATTPTTVLLTGTSKVNGLTCSFVGTVGTAGDLTWNMANCDYDTVVAAAAAAGG